MSNVRGIFDIAGWIKPDDHLPGGGGSKHVVIGRMESYWNINLGVSRASPGSFIYQVGSVSTAAKRKDDS